MNTLKTILTRYFTVGIHFIILMLSIVKTSCKRGLLKFRKQRVQHPHLQAFINKKQQNGCNLSTLADLLKGQASEKVIVSELVNKQNTYRAKNDLLKMLPELSNKTEIIAIPIAIKAFSFFRHFVTIIIDNRAGIIEFYDPIGFTTSQYKNAVLWGPKCHKKDLLLLSELIEHIKKHYQIDKMIENTEIHQTDFNQCALFVYDRIYKRGIKGFSFNEAGKVPLSSKQAFV